MEAQQMARIAEEEFDVISSYAGDGTFTVLVSDFNAQQLVQYAERLEAEFDIRYEDIQVFVESEDVAVEVYCG